MSELPGRVVRPLDLLAAGREFDERQAPRPPKPRAPRAASRHGPRPRKGAGLAPGQVKVLALLRSGLDREYRIARAARLTASGTHSALAALARRGLVRRMVLPPAQRIGKDRGVRWRLVERVAGQVPHYLPPALRSA